MSNQKKHCITVITDYGYIEITNLKSVWINKYLGTYRLMYEDEVYKYNCIYWSDKNLTDLYQSLKQKLIEAYNRGNSIVEL